MRSLCATMLHRAAVTRGPLRKGFVPFSAGSLPHQFRGQWSLPLGRLPGIFGRPFTHPFTSQINQHLLGMNPPGLGNILRMKRWIREPLGKFCGQLSSVPPFFSALPPPPYNFQTKKFIKFQSHETRAILKVKNFCHIWIKSKKS